MNFSLIKRAVMFVIEHKSAMLTAIGCVGVVATAVISATDTPDAQNRIAEKEVQKAEEIKSNDAIVELELSEKITAAIPAYIPTILAGSATIACFIAAHVIDSKQKAVLGAAATLSEGALRTYKKKIAETFGEKKFQKVVDDISQDKISKDNKPTDTKIKDNMVIIQPTADQLFYDGSTGRYFKSSVDRVRNLENELNKELMEISQISLNDWYYGLGLKTISGGDNRGWDITKGDKIDVIFSTCLAENDKACIVVNFRDDPRLLRS